ncbi:MAG: GyrI-like domain-containing protein [Oscillospiraceae bacterium]|nr:GyrI-like domain-containing protein [Oscillospiraceae bacterium]
MAGAFDFKKENRDLYLPKTKPGVIDVPEMTFIMVDGKGNPNTAQAYKTALELLYGFSYSIKMSKMGGAKPKDYFEYVVPPLEGLWWGEGEYFDGKNIIDKDKLHWTSMIRQPDFVTREVFEEARRVLAKKKPGLDLSLARLVSFTEGLCAQIMHIGSYDGEPATIEVLDGFIAGSDYKSDISQTRRHHEIYLGDPRKCAPDKLKTVIRHPVVRR